MTRQHLGRFLYHRHLRDGELQVIELSPGTEELLNGTACSKGIGAQCAELEPVLKTVTDPVLLVPHPLRGPLWDGLSYYLDDLTVLAYSEIEPGQTVRRLFEL